MTTLSPEEALHLGMQLCQEKQYARALSVLVEAYHSPVTKLRAYHVSGVCYRGLGELENAVHYYRKVLDKLPWEHSTWSNLANAHKDLKQLAIAEYCILRAIILSPQEGDLYHNYGSVLLLTNRAEEAIRRGTQALTINPHHAEARWNRSRALLHLGNYAKGWDEFDARWHLPEMIQKGGFQLPAPPWQGENYSGRRLLLILEQGFGDMIWAARYIPQVSQLAYPHGQLMVHCQPELQRLFSTQAWDLHLVTTGDSIPRPHCALPFASLPGLFSRRMEDIPSAPYLKPDSQIMEKFRPWLAMAGNKMKVGIVWSGSLAFTSNKDRATTLDRFFHAFHLPGVQLFSLQKGEPAQTLDHFEHRQHIIDMSPLLDNFADTAALVAQLDLVIMTDSSVAHLTGALGKPVWVLLSLMSHWLWLLEREDSPWYPSMRLFRQRSWGDWNGVFDQATTALYHRLNAMDYPLVLNF